MASFKLMQIHDELAALAARQESFNTEPPAIPWRLTEATQEDLAQWMEAVRHHWPITAQRLHLERDLLEESLRRIGGLKR